MVDLRTGLRTRQIGYFKEIEAGVSKANQVILKTWLISSASNAAFCT